MGILIDVPQIAYKTWVLDFVDKNTGEIMYNEERELENSLKEFLYNKEHDHVK